MKVIWLVNLAILFAFIKVFEIPSMIPLLVDELHISYAQAGLFMTAYTVVRCLASLPAGSVTDRLGAAPVICVCLLGVGLLGILGTVGDNYYVLLALRVLVAIGISIIFIAAVDSIPKYMPPEQVGKGIGYINGSLNIGIALAMFMTPILADTLGWRWTARIFSLSFLLLFIISLPLLRNPPPTAGPDKPAHNEGSTTIGALLRNPCVMLLAFGACVLFVELYGVLTWVPVFLGSYSGGYLLEQTGHYDPAFMLFSIAAIISIVALLAVSRLLHNNPPAHFKLKLGS